MFRASRVVWMIMLASLLAGSIVGVGAVAAAQGGNKAPKVTVCHVPADTPSNVREMSISGNALPAHLTHGDALPASYYPDTDGDGYGDPNGSSPLVCTQPDGFVADRSDCNDSAIDVNPGAAEVCGDDIDNNCSGEVDEGCAVACQTFEGGATTSKGGWYSAAALHSAHVNAYNICSASCAGTCTLRSGFSASNWTPRHDHNGDGVDDHRHATSACLVDGCIDPID